MAKHDFYYLDEAAKRVSKITHSDVSIEDLEHWAIKNKFMLSVSAGKWFVRFSGSGETSFRFDGFIHLDSTTLKAALQDFRSGIDAYCVQVFPIRTSEIPAYNHRKRMEETELLHSESSSSCAFRRSDLVVRNADLEYLIQNVFGVDPSKISSSKPSQTLVPKQHGSHGNGNYFLLAGDFWKIRFNGSEASLKDTKGLRYISHLILNQGKQISVSDLYYAINPPDSEVTDHTHSAMNTHQLDESGLSVSDFGDSGDVLTPDGKNRLQMTLQDLKDQIEDAIELGDEVQQEVLETRYEEILSHVKSQTGLGGRTRKASSGIERFRKAVSKRISADIQKISTTLPDLGRHLKETLSTGSQCKYDPYPYVIWAFKEK